MSFSKQKFTQELKANMKLRNRQQITKMLQISQLTIQDPIQRSQVSKDFLLNLARPKFDNFYLSENILNKFQKQIRDREEQNEIQQIIYWKNISQFLTSQIKYSHQNSQKQKEKTNRIIKDFLWKPDIDEIQETPPFYTMLIKRQDDSPREKIEKNIDLWQKMILLREQVKFYMKSKSLFKFKPISNDLVYSYDTDKIQKLSRASSFCDVFSLTQFNTFSIEGDSNFQTFSDHLKSSLKQYFYSDQYTNYLNTNKQQAISQIYKESPLIYFSTLTRKHEKEQQQQGQNNVSNDKKIEMAHSNDRQFVHDIKRQKQKVDVSRRKQKLEQREKQKPKQKFNMPNYRIHHIDNMKDINKLRDQRIFSKADMKLKMSKYSPQKQFFKNSKNSSFIFKAKDQDNLLSKMKKPLFTSKSLYSTKNDNNKNSKSGYYSMITNKEVYDILYNDQKPNELIEKLEIDFPKKKKGAFESMKQKKFVSNEETSKQMRENQKNIQSIQLNIMSKSSKHISVSSKTQSQSQSQLPYSQIISSEGEVQSLSSLQSEISSDLSSIQDLKYTGKSKLIQKKYQENMKVQFPIRLHNLIIEQNQAFLQYQLYRINLQSFQKILRQDKQKYQCMNIRIWFSSNHTSMRQNQKLNEIALIAKKLSMDLYFGDFQKTHREESAMSRQDILKLQGAAMFAKMTLFQVAWKISDEKR